MPPTEENVYEVEEMLDQPGTYFNPQTEVVVIVDDSASIDQEVFNNLEGLEGAEWVRVSDDVPVDEDGRDRALEAFETHYTQGGTADRRERPRRERRRPRRRRGTAGTGPRPRGAE